MPARYTFGADLYSVRGQPAAEVFGSSTAVCSRDFGATCAAERRPASPAAGRRNLATLQEASPAPTLAGAIRSCRAGRRCADQPGPGAQRRRPRASTRAFDGQPFTRTRAGGTRLGDPVKAAGCSPFAFRVPRWFPADGEPRLRLARVAGVRSARRRLLAAGHDAAGAPWSRAGFRLDLGPGHGATASPALRRRCQSRPIDFAAAAPARSSIELVPAGIVLLERRP